MNETQTAQTPKDASRQASPEARRVILDVLIDLMTVGDANAYDAAEIISLKVFGCMPTELPDFSENELDGTLSHAKTFAARVLGIRGGRKGGLQRAKNLSSERRKKIAHDAALARWHPDSTQYQKIDLSPSATNTGAEGVSKS